MDEVIERLNKAKWYPLKTLDFSIIPSSSGVYQVRWTLGDILRQYLAQMATTRKGFYISVKAAI